MGLPRLIHIRRGHPMGSSLAGMSRAARRRLVRLERKSRDPLIVRRASAVRRLGEGRSFTEVSIEMAAARSSVQGWRDLFVRDGEAGLVPQRRGAPPTTVTPTLIQHLLTLAPQSPRELDYLCNTWTSELFAKELARHYRQDRPCLDRAPATAAPGLGLAPNPTDAAHLRPALSGADDRDQLCARTGGARR